MKVFSSEAQQRLNLTASELMGGAALDLSEDSDRRGGERSWYEGYLQTFGGTISAGSSEIQRNIVSEKVLGLPRG